MKILWLSPRLPLPDHTGAAKATLTLLEELKSAGQDISLSVVCLGDELPSQKTISEIEERTKTSGNLYLRKNILPLGSKALGFLFDKFINRNIPFTLSRCKSQRIENEILNWNNNRTWDVTIVDGLHAAEMVNLADARFGRIVYRAHNVETDLWAQIYQKETSSIKRLIFKREFELYQKFEKNFCQKSLVLTVSQTDANRMQELGFTPQAKSLPIGLRFEMTHSAITASQKIELLFVGRLDWHPNKDGLLWFLNNVWPNLDQQRLNLTVVGSGESQWLAPYEASNLQIFRSVPELKTYYTKSYLTLIPLFMGSGTRVKAIESAAYGRSFIATSLGIAGVPVTAGHDYIEANTATDWIKALNNLTFKQCENLGQNIQQKIKAQFDQHEVAKLFMSQIAEGKSWEQTSVI
ncbi:MAG: glycosyltransferase family 4 protein [Bdellovibrionota bacterium]